ncbi:MAG: glycosyltransferase [Lachnospiraceae bacterium]|nr:glycosyltransferase [Lachnospiraceae bacterium]
MKEAFDGFKNLTVVSVSPWLMDRAKRSPILAGKNHTVVMNGLDTDIFKPYDTKTLRAELGLDNKKVVFHASPNFNNDPNHIKGGHYVLKLAEQLKDENTMFVIAGNHPENLVVPDNVILLGNISDQQKLARLYSMADVTLLTSRKETFSMICAESLCCGTPVVGFKAGAPEQIAISEYSTFVEHGNVNALQQAVMDQLQQEKKDRISQDAINKYSKSIMAQRYFDIYREMI